jgi:hypothetical protein
MMFYNDMPLIIPLLATGYVLMIYLLLALAKYTTNILWTTHTDLEYQVQFGRAMACLYTD